MIVGAMATMVVVCTMAAMFLLVVMGMMAVVAATPAMVVACTMTTMFFSALVVVVAVVAAIVAMVVLVAMAAMVLLAIMNVVLAMIVVSAMAAMVLMAMVVVATLVMVAITHWLSSWRLISIQSPRGQIRIKSPWWRRRSIKRHHRPLETLIVYVKITTPTEKGRPKNHQVTKVAAGYVWWEVEGDELVATVGMA